MMSRMDRLWLALRILRGELVRWSASANRTEVVMDFVGRDRERLQEALNPSGRTAQRR